MIWVNVPEKRLNYYKCLVRGDYVIRTFKTICRIFSITRSVSLHASGKLSVECFGVSEIGTSFLGNVHVGKNFAGKIHYVEGDELITEMKSDDQITDLLNIK